MELTKYDESWMDAFKIEKEKLLHLIGDFSVRIEHVGSTSIRDAIAKPIIDIAIQLKSFDDEKSIADRLSSHGYEYKGENGIKGRMYFVKRQSDLTLFHIHAYEKENPLFEDHLLFRDFMNNNRLFVDGYSKLKLQLKEQFQDDRESYTEGKKDFISKILKKARAKYNEYIREFNHPFKGWDFSHLKKRMINEEVSWDYKEIVERYTSKSLCMLDMGTGGGEFLSTVRNLPKNTYATEGYPPNVEVAKKKLSPLGVNLVEVTDDKNLNLKSHFFDLVINRHESYDESEIHRIMSLNSLFITQQVGGHDCHELNEFLHAPINQTFDFWNLSYATNKLSEHFKVIETKSEYLKTTFHDVGAIIYYLKVVEWQIPGFNVLDYFGRLLALENYIKQNRKFTATSERFLLIAKKIS
ncbi:MAG: GrpB family protein [Clostridia bacterium]|nr:GrpB family protein [Clostridia bacterium]